MNGHEDDHIRTEPETNRIKIGYNSRGTIWEVVIVGDDPDKAAKKAIEIEQKIAGLYGPKPDPSVKDQLTASVEAEGQKQKDGEK